MRLYGKSKQKPDHRQMSRTFLNMTVFTEKKAPNSTPMCLRDVWISSRTVYYASTAYRALC